VERYIAVCHPLQARKWITKGRAKLATISVFAFALLLATWSYIYAYYIKHGYEIYAAISLHFVPFIVVLILNIHIYFEVNIVICLIPNKCINYLTILL